MTNPYEPPRLAIVAEDPPEEPRRPSIFGLCYAAVVYAGFPCLAFYEFAPRVGVPVAIEISFVCFACAFFGGLSGIIFAASVEATDG